MDRETETIGSEPSAPPAAVVEPGARIDRYLVETPIGKGGMGIVYRARDSELDRRVALKLVRDASLREAKAMAALQHPNVVTLYDVGEHAGQVYLAMELATQTLREWLAAAPRSWRAIVDAFVQAARGLAAAHELGIVHRDFKPDNVFVGTDGRVRVGDFGLSGAVEHAPAIVVGTLRYMAPEQLAGERADARSDQFSFCVALYEALYGVRPFAGDTIEELRDTFDAAREPEPPSDRAVPGWLARIVARGLAIDPAQRFASMADVIDALTVEPARRKRRLVAAAAGAAIVASSGVAFFAGHSPAESSPCDGGRAALATVYRPDVEAKLLARFTASPSAYVREVGDHLVGRLRRYTSDWVKMHGETCAATVVHGTQSPELMDLRMSCLDDRLREASALFGELAVAGDDQLKLAMDAAGKLGALERCADERALRAQVEPPPDPSTRTSIELVRWHLLGAKFAEATGAYKRSLLLAENAQRIAEQAGYAPVKAEALLQVGLALSRLERGAEASDRLHQAAITADGSRHDEIAASARIALVFSLGVRESKYAEAERLAEYAAAAIQRAGGSPRLTADLLINHAAVLNRSERPTQALPLSLEALAIIEGQQDRDELLLARVYNRVGNDVTNLGRYAEGLPYYDRALELYEKNLGAGHPQVAMVLTNRGGTLRYLARYDEAIEHHRRSLVIREQVFGADHPEVAASLTNLANTLHAKGQREEALVLRERAAAIAEQKLPVEHTNAILMRLNWLDSMMQLGRDPEAVAFCAKWLPGERTARPDRPTTGKYMATCAVSYLRLGQTRFAWDLYRAAAALIAKHQDPLAEDYLLPFAQTLLERGQAAEALPLLERALANALETVGTEHPDTAWLAGLVERARTGAGKVQ